MKSLHITVCVLASASSCVATAQTVWYVDSTSTCVSPDPLQCGTTWANAFADLQSALAIAQSGDQIWIAEGVYRPSALVDPADMDPRTVTFSIPDGVQVYGGFQNGDSSLAVRTGGPTVLDGDLGATGKAYHVVSVLNGTEGSGTRLDLLVIRNGRADRIDSFTQLSIGSYSRGAGVIAVGGTPEFVNCEFLQNTAEWVGEAVPADPLPGYIGGAAVAALLSNPRFEACRFEENLASGGKGGALMVAAEANELFLTEVTDCEFVDNQSLREPFAGGALYFAAGTLRLEGSVFQGNSADLGVLGNQPATHGGAVMIAGAAIAERDIRDLSCQIEIVSCDFEGNSAGTQGGAVAVRNEIPVSISLSSFQSNTIIGQANARSLGGAITILAESGATEISGCSFKLNSAPGSSGDGGAISTQGGGMISSSVFEDNSAGGVGGGIYVDAPSGQVRIEDCSFNGNSSGIHGGALYGTAECQVLRCVFEGNEALQDGGAVFLTTAGTPGACLQDDGVHNSTFVENVANRGGGLFVETVRAGSSSSPSSAASNCTYFGNSASTGAAVYLDGLPVSTDCALMRNSILWNNSGGSPIALGTGVSISDVLVEYCIVEGGWGGAGASTVLNTDPLFVAPTSGDLRLQSTSPAIDAGRNDGLAGADRGLDLGLAQRFVDSASITDTGLGAAPVIDMGAFEFGGLTGRCKPADIALPLGVLDLADTLAFVTLFNADHPLADVAESCGVWDQTDLTTFVEEFTAGCP